MTGGGKTAFALLAFERVLDQNPMANLVVLVPSISLMDQWMVASEDLKDVEGDDIASYSGEGAPDRQPRVSVVVINTGRKIANELIDRNNTMLVVDECHRAGSPENARAIWPESPYRLGLSATPVREFDDGFETYVEPAIGSVFFEYDYQDARRDGVISPFSLHNFRFELGNEEERDYQERFRTLQQSRLMSAARGSVEESPRIRGLRSEVERTSLLSPRRAVATVAVSQKMGGRQIVFHERIDAAERIASHLGSRGDRVGLYHSQMAASIRRRNLELFKSGGFQKIVTCRALDEGLNVPDASVAIVGASTRSVRQRIQRMGRVLRASGQKEYADVATVYSTEEEADRLREEASQMADIADVRWYEIKI